MSTDLVLVIIQEDKFPLLPQSTQEWLRLFNVKSHKNGVLAFKIPEYRIKELQEEKS